MPRPHLSPALAALLALTAAAPEARAQSTDAERMAQAIALYNQAVEQMRAHDYAGACPKLAAAVRLDPSGVGGKLKLAECYEAAGKRASAWAAYELAEAAAAQAKQASRQRKARERREALKDGLGQLTIVVPKAVADLPGLEIRRNGVPVGPAEWGAALPVDQGPQVITATATGKEPWQTSVDAVDGGTSSVEVHELASTPPPPAPPPPPPVVVPVPVMVMPPQVVAPPPPPPPSIWSNQRKASVVVGGIGAVVLGTGVAYGILTVLKRDESNRGHCFGNRCDPTGIQLRQDGIGFANTSTALTIAGSILLGGGVVLFATAPRASAPSSDPAPAVRTPPVAVAIGSRGLQLSTTW